MKWTVSLLKDKLVFERLSKEEMYDKIYNDVRFQNGLNTADKIFKKASLQKIGDVCMTGQIKITRTE